MIFFLIFLLFCAALASGIYYFKRHKFQDLTLLFFALIIIFGATMLWFFMDIPRGSTIVETEISIDRRNSSAGGRAPLIMRFTDSEGRRYWGLGAFTGMTSFPAQNVPVRIVYLPTSGFVLQVERYFASSLAAFPELAATAPPSFATSSGYQPMYHYAGAITLFIFCIFLGMIITMLRNMYAESVSKKKPRKHYRRKKRKKR
ncbi:MAG: hypothetical protein FWG38_05805 [Defluviitaleaceae bacterium]|nr:hypothetical protein [Defluviitaleaceae bacterium]